MSSNTHGSFTFDGVNKIISCELGTVSFSATEVYSRWKSWVQEDPERAKYEPAFNNSLGGESLGGGVLVGSYVFLQNGWKIRPQEQNHQLIISGNLFPIPDTAALFTNTIGSYKAVIGMRTSSLTQQVISSSGGSSVSASDVASAVWDKQLSGHVTPGTFGHFVSKKLLSVTKFLGFK